MVPAAAVQVGRFLEPALDLVAQDESDEEFLSAGALGLGDRQAGWDVVAGMSGFQANVPVTEVEVAQHCTVDEGGWTRRRDVPGLIWQRKPRVRKPDCQ